MRGATSLHPAMGKGGSLAAFGSNLDPTVSPSTLWWWWNTRGKSQVAPAVNRNRENRSSQTTNSSCSVFSLFVLPGCCSNPVSYSLHTYFSSVPFLFCFDFHIPLHLQSKPMRGKSNNCRVDTCHHLVYLAHRVINVFCRVLCKARICPWVLVRHYYPNIH